MSPDLSPVAQLGLAPDLVEGVIALGVILTLVVHGGLALAIHSSVRAERSPVWSDRRLGPPWLWVLATLTTGLLGAVAWWAIHRSNLGPVPGANGDEPATRA